MSDLSVSPSSPDRISTSHPGRALVGPGLVVGGLILAAVALGGVGCGADTSGTAVSVDECQAGLKWTGGDSESPNMRPGGNCINCHASEGEGPSYSLAGTVFEGPKEADDCFGVSGATVVVTDANGQVHEYSTNEAGNFYGTSTVALPYTAKVVFQGKERVMATPQQDPNCANCHTQNGANGAPGRILLPQ